MTIGRRHKEWIYRGRIGRTDDLVSWLMYAWDESSMAHTLVNLDVCALTAAKGVVSGSALSISEVGVATSAEDLMLGQVAGWWGFNCA